MQKRARGEIVPALGFQVLTPIYDAVVRVTTREHTFKSALVAQANVRPGHHVLDLACGTGTLAVHLKQSCPDAEVVVVDADEKILSIARRKTHEARVRIQLDRGHSHKLPYPDSHFDLVPVLHIFTDGLSNTLRILGGNIYTHQFLQVSGYFAKGRFGTQARDLALQPG